MFETNMLRRKDAHALRVRRELGLHRLKGTVQIRSTSASASFIFHERRIDTTNGSRRFLAVTLTDGNDWSTVKAKVLVVPVNCSSAKLGRVKLRSNMFFLFCSVKLRKHDWCLSREYNLERSITFQSRNAQYVFLFWSVKLRKQDWCLSREYYLLN